MTEQEILKELKSVKEKVSRLDKELHHLREDFADTHLTIEERDMIKEALDEEKRGETISLTELRKRFGL